MPGEAIVTIKDKQWSCWVASTPEELQAGLSGVPSIAPGTGMLFILPQEQIVTVSGAGMLFPVSIIFIGGNLLVTEVALSLYPDDMGITNLPCKYFLEVNFNEVIGIKGGDSVSIQIVQAPGISDWMTPVVMIAGVMMVGALIAQVGKTMLEKPREKLEIYGPRGELLPQTSRGLYQRDRDGYPVGADRIMREEWGPIPDPDQPFLSKRGFMRPSKIYGWSFQADYNEWRAFVRFPHGEETWTSPLRRPLHTKPQSLPQTKGAKPSRHDVEIGTWAERDRLGIWLTDKRTDKTIAEWWDEDAREMFEQGWFKPGDIRHQTITGRAFEESVLDYAESVGLIAGGGKYLPQTIRDAYYWTAVNKDTGEITESFTPYTSSGRALRGGKAYASRHWKATALVEVWREPFRYSESLKIQPVASETLSLGRQKAPAVIPEHKRQPGLRGEIEFLPDSPEFLAYTIDDIGYREKIDTAFQNAIKRAKGSK